MKEQKYFRQTCHSFDWFLEHVVGQDRKWIPLNTDQEVQKSGKLKSGNQCVGLNIGMGLFSVTKPIYGTHWYNFERLRDSNIPYVVPPSGILYVGVFQNFTIKQPNFKKFWKNKPQKIILWWSNHARRLIQFGL